MTESGVAGFMSRMRFGVNYVSEDQDEANEI